jgi:peptide/nickel transport system permease protein
LAGEDSKSPGETGSGLIGRRWHRPNGAWAAGGSLALLILAVVVGPFCWEHDYQERVGPILQRPGGSHWLGTDDLGRDVLVRLLYAGRFSLAVGTAAALTAGLVGTAVGLTAGLRGGWVDGILMRLTDAFLALPALPVLLILAALDLEKPQAFLQDRFGWVDWKWWLPAIRLVGVVALFNWMGTARLVRAQVLSLRQSPFILAARAAGVRGWRIGWRHLLPHCLGPILVATSAAVGSNILYEAVLGFLGLGLPPPTPSWGGMLQNARAYSNYRAPWLIYFPGLSITLTVFCVNILADRFQERADPRRRLGR